MLKNNLMCSHRDFLLPAPASDGDNFWTGRFLTSAKANSFMKKLFDRLGLALVGQKVSSHSMKATALSWCAKYGIDEDNRAILARHASSVKGATAVYSRDQCCREIVHPSDSADAKFSVRT